MQDPAQPGALKFEIEVGEGRGALHLRPGTFSGWLSVERLELEIPEREPLREPPTPET